MKELSVSFVFFFVCQNLWCGNSFKLAPLSRAIHPSSKLYKEKKTQLHPAGSTRNAFRLNLLTDRDDSFTTALNRAARSPNTEDISAYSELISPKSVALGSIATLSAGTVYWAMLKNPFIGSIDTPPVDIAKKDSIMTKLTPNALSVGVSEAVKAVAGAAALPLAVFMIWRFARHQDELAFEREMKRIQQYKEEMYFEAVQEIFLKLNNPDIGFASADNLKRQLVVLDPDGSIREYVISGGKRPDISKLVESNSERYAMRDKKRKISLKPTLEVASIATELTALVKRIETTLQNKYDGATRKRITDKIKKSFTDFDPEQAKQALTALSGNLDNDLYWAEFVDKLS